MTRISPAHCHGTLQNKTFIAPISSARHRKRRKFSWSAILTTGIRGLRQWPANLMADGWPVLNLPTDTMNTSSWWMASRCSTRMPRGRQSTPARNRYHSWPSAKHMSASSLTSTRPPLRRSIARDKRMTEVRAAKQKQFKRNDTLRTPVSLRLRADVLTLVKATCAAFGGAGRMTLAEWRDAEEQLRQKVAHENRKTR